MFYVNTKCVAIGKCGVTKCFRAPTKRLLGTKQQLATAASTSHDEAKDVFWEWKSARAFSELPKDGALRMVSKFLPGGRYYKLDCNQLEKAMHKDFGDIFVVPGAMGRPDTLVTHNPDDFACVIRSEGVSPIRPFSTLRYHRNKRHADFFKGVEGVLTTQGTQWSSFRSAVNPLLMQPKNMHLYFSKMAKLNQEFVDRIRLIRDPNSLEMPVDFEDQLQCWLLESLSIVALDKQLGLFRENNENNADAMKLLSALNTIFTLAFELEWKPSLWRQVSTPKFKRLMRAMDEVQSVSLKFVDQAVARLASEKQQGIERVEHEQSTFEKLLKIDQKTATLLTMTASLVTGILLCLAKNPEKQQKLRQEVMGILPQRGGDFTTDTLSNIPYLRACIKESLRIYPLSVGVVRVIQNNLVLSGYRVPKGTLVNMVASTLLADEKHFSRPLEFLPERWLRSEKANDEVELDGTAVSAQALKPSNPFIFLPFGVGPRVCLGRRVSELEVELGIARLVRNFQIEFNYPTDNAFKSLFINMPNIPLRFKFTDIE